MSSDMKKRIVNQHELAKKFAGPFQFSRSWRFFPDVSDDDPDANSEVLPDDDAAAAVIKEAKDKEEAEAKENQAKFEKNRQKADQEAANASKANERAAQAEQRLAAVEQENEANKTKLAELEVQAAKQGVDTTIDLDEGDYEQPGDIKLVRAIKATNEKIAASAKVQKLETEALKKDRDAFKAEQVAARAIAARDAEYSGLLAGLDTDYGAEHRNTAVAAFNKLAAEGKVPKSTAMATRVMEKCYKDAAKAAKDKPKNDNLPLDPGTGGSGGTNLSKTTLTSGSLEQVSAQVLAAGKD